MREELREAYVERMSETDHQILWHRQMTDEDEELSAHAKRHIEYLLKNLADEFDEKLNLTLSEMDEKGISEDEFMAFDIMIQTAMNWKRRMLSGSIGVIVWRTTLAKQSTMTDLGISRVPRNTFGGREIGHFSPPTTFGVLLSQSNYYHMVGYFVFATPYTRNLG
jgi:hypothetical protein